ncbi:MAG: carboxypeptidase-like regulatory domain-containing protein [Bacteroidales bacterium]|nr:carboxypeptidase-like regulatory domain-containing protein [Bacteroidales bacterium]
MKRILILSALSLFVIVKSWSQAGNLSGKITDAETGEDLIGATVVIQGTVKGTITDFEGNYILDNISPGKYNIVVSYISYDQQIFQVDISSGATTTLDVKLKSATIGLDEVVIKKTRRTDTEISLMSSIKSGNLIVSGISAQQISKSQDKDAAEVIRRVPGITITDGRFVIVRGLYERYNSILLNGTTAPSFETDKRSFSFDAIPSNMIDNIYIYKSPAPELPADFAGAAINIVTKGTADENSAFVTYSTGYNNEVTFDDFYTYKGGKYDWMGFDDGTRQLPSAFPSSAEMEELFKFTGTVEENNLKKAKLEAISKSFDNESFNLKKITAIPNQGFMAGINRRFVLGKITIGNLTAVNYSLNNEINCLTKTEYSNIEPTTSEGKPAYRFPDESYITSVKMGLLHNWLFIFGNNQRIELRNFLIQLGKDRTTLRSGENYYIGSEPDTLLGREMHFNSRFIYSGQLSGKFNLNRSNTLIDWIAGYSITSNNEPDIKRLRYSKQENPRTGLKEYRLIIPTSVVPYETGRLYLGLEEKIYNAVLNIKQPFNMWERNFVFKTGFFFEQRIREFDARNIGIRQARPSSFRINTFLPVEELLDTSNFYFNEGLIYGESYKANNSYNVDLKTASPYFGLEIPVLQNLILYSGVRMEQYTRKLYGFQEDPAVTPDRVFDTLDIFFSANLTYKINEMHIIRASYGKTVNRPEFREIAPFAFVDFQRFATVYGNDTLTNSYIHNFDLRYEWYPTESEIISLGVFYKNFSNPIELLLYPGSNGWEYIPFNTQKSESKGIELDLRKRFFNLEGTSGAVKFLRNITILFNASVIDSKVSSSFNFSRDKNRPMVGQSPYIINAGVYYQNTEHRSMVSLMYNRIGERIVALGSQDFPNTWEMPRNSLDLTIAKGFGKHMELKAGFKNILNDPFVFRQDWDYNENDIQKTRSLVTEKYTEGIVSNISFSYKF